jgi:hypothetical protein
MKQKWEYLWVPMVLDESSKNQLDAVGDDGWELVGLVKAESKDLDPSLSPVYHAICKRPK